MRNDSPHLGAARAANKLRRPTFSGQRNDSPRQTAVGTPRPQHAPGLAARCSGNRLISFKGSAAKDKAPEANTTAASYRRFKGLHKRFMRGIAERADIENEEHLKTLCNLAADMASAASKWDEWTDGQIARAADDCDKAREAFFAFRRDAQRAGVDKTLIRQALVAKRQLVAARDELRRVQK